MSRQESEEWAAQDLIELSSNRVTVCKLQTNLQKSRKLRETYRETLLENIANMETSEIFRLLIILMNVFKKIVLLEFLKGILV